MSPYKKFITRHSSPFMQEIWQRKGTTRTTKHKSCMKREGFVGKEVKEMGIDCYTVLRHSYMVYCFQTAAG